MFDDPRLNWLIFEGLIPLIGAGVLYLIWGFCRYITSSSPFTYQWTQAIDPLGWLYGAIVLAIQSALKTVSVESNYLFLRICCIATALICFLLLIAAMTERGQSSTWQPTKSLQFFSIALVAAILYTGFQVQDLSIKSASTKNVPTKDESVIGGEK